MVDTALAVIAEGFDADAVVLVRREDPNRPPVVSSRIPPSWDEASGFTFELFGQLWRLLEAPESAPDAPPGPGGQDGLTLQPHASKWTHLELVREVAMSQKGGEPVPVNELLQVYRSVPG